MTKKEKVVQALADLDQAGRFPHKKTENLEMLGSKLAWDLGYSIPVSPSLQVEVLEEIGIYCSKRNPDAGDEASVGDRVLPKGSYCLLRTDDQMKKDEAASVIKEVVLPRIRVAGGVNGHVSEMKESIAQALTENNECSNIEEAREFVQRLLTA